VENRGLISDGLNSISERQVYLRRIPECYEPLTFRAWSFRYSRRVSAKIPEFDDFQTLLARADVACWRKYIEDAVFSAQNLSGLGVGAGGVVELMGQA